MAGKTQQSNMTIIAAVAVVVVLIVGYVAFSYTSASGSGTKGAAGGSTNQGAPSTGANNMGAAGAGTSTGTGSNTGTFQGYSAAPCGPGNSCISQSEAISMVGPGGTYTSGYIQDFAGAEAKAAALTGSNYSDYVYTNNITSLYLVEYNSTPASSSSNAQAFQNAKALIETVMVSPHPEAIYAYNIKSAFGNFTVQNATQGGLTYSYLGSNGTYGINSTYLIGWKNGEFVWVTGIGTYIPPATLASVVSGDMP